MLNALLILSRLHECFQDARKILRPLIRVVHPDLISDAPPTYRDTNAKSLALLHSLIDALESTSSKPLKLAPKYDLKFHIRFNSDTKELSADAANWKVISRTLAFPPKLVSARGEVAAAALRAHIDGEISALMHAAGLQQQPMNNLRAKRMTSVRTSLRNRNSQRESAGAQSRQKSEEGLSEAAAFKSILHTMAKRESALPFVNEVLAFIYGPAPTAIAGSRSLQARLGGMAAQLEPEEADAAMRTAALFRSGRLLVDDRLSMADATKLLRRFGHACIRYHSALYIVHPAWEKVVIVLSDQSEGEGEGEDTSIENHTRPFSSPLLGKGFQDSEKDQSQYNDPEAWTLRVAKGFSDMGLIREVAKKFSPSL